MLPFLFCSAQTKISPVQTIVENQEDAQLQAFLSVQISVLHLKQDILKKEGQSDCYEI